MAQFSHSAANGSESALVENLINDVMINLFAARDAVRDNVVHCQYEHVHCAVMANNKLNCDARQ